MAENAVETLLSALATIVAKGLPDVDDAKYFQKGTGKGLKQEDLAANLKLARCICALHGFIFDEDDHITIGYQRDFEGYPVGFMEEIDFGRKGFRLTVPSSAGRLEAYGGDCVRMYGLEKEYPSGFLEIGILMFACHLIRQYCQSMILKQRFDQKKNFVLIGFADKGLSHRLARVNKLFETEESMARNISEIPFQFDGRVVQMAVLEALAKNGTAGSVVNTLVSEPPTIRDLLLKLILG